jgi:hypothetical protein
MKKATPLHSDSAPGKSGIKIRAENDGGTLVRLQTGLTSIFAAASGFIALDTPVGAVAFGIATYHIGKQAWSGIERLNDTRRNDDVDKKEYLENRLSSFRKNLLGCTIIGAIVHECADAESPSQAFVKAAPILAATVLATAASQYDAVPRVFHYKNNK